MTCACIHTAYKKFGQDLDLLDAKFYDIKSLPGGMASARDIYFQHVLDIAKDYPVPRHADLTDDDDRLRLILRFRDQDALIFDLTSQKVPKKEVKSARELISNPPENIRHFGIQTGYWACSIILGVEYDRDNYYQILEQWLLGKIE